MPIREDGMTAARMHRPGLVVIAAVDCAGATLDRRAAFLEPIAAGPIQAECPFAVGPSDPLIVAETRLFFSEPIDRGAARGFDHRNGRGRTIRHVAKASFRVAMQDGKAVGGVVLAHRKGLRLDTLERFVVSTFQRHTENHRGPHAVGDGATSQRVGRHGRTTEKWNRLGDDRRILWRPPMDINSIRCC
jgi:hypothetical protein